MRIRLYTFKTLFARSPDKERGRSEQLGRRTCHRHNERDDFEKILKGSLIEVVGIAAAVGRMSDVLFWL